MTLSYSYLIAKGSIMKKTIALCISLVALSGLAACGRGKTCKQAPCPCPQKECPEETRTVYKRVSGPMSDKEVGWTENDRK